MYKRKSLDYHVRKFRKCPFCNLERKRNIIDGRNKGHYKICGSKECIYKSKNRPEVNAKKAHRGSAHPRWIEDRSKVKFRPRYELTLWRKAVFERDDFICQKCRKRGGRLQAHHIFGYNQFPHLRWNLDNGITLCVGCHKETDNYGSKGRINNSSNIESAADCNGDSRAFARGAVCT